MKKTGLIGCGYWGKKIEDKLNVLSEKIFVQTSKNYDPKYLKNVEWVFIATPTHTHYKIAKDCLNNGVNVFLEKPFCTSLNEAKELVDLAKIKKLSLYIDNVFIHRNEFLSIKKTQYENLKFLWQKNGPYNDSLFNDLLYHDLYVLISLVGNQDITSIDFIKCTDNYLHLKIVYGISNVEFIYDRNKYLIKNKKIILDGSVINFHDTNQDPLSLIISKCLSGEINFEYNQSLNLLVMMLMDGILNSSKIKGFNIPIRN